MMMEGAWGDEVRKATRGGRQGKATQAEQPSLQRAYLVHVDDPIVGVRRVMGEGLQHPGAGDGERAERLLLVERLVVLLAVDEAEDLLRGQVEEGAARAAEHAGIDKHLAEACLEVGDALGRLVRDVDLPN